ncbi:hypothetical protein EYF80_050997 [Liparis tanakae]|uniref:Uncharacterized protein n=1 Tax=Liparis tanakae TaxID=230148 RepID=A0A4Z2FD74_9TELE|nr:hypothetical protein EYF80_050997 [Liparis tanakae]
MGRSSPYLRRNLPWLWSTAHSGGRWRGRMAVRKCSLQRRSSSIRPGRPRSALARTTFRPRRSPRLQLGGPPHRLVRQLLLFVVVGEEALDDGPQLFPPLLRQPVPGGEQSPRRRAHAAPVRVLQQADALLAALRGGELVGQALLQEAVVHVGGGVAAGAEQQDVVGVVVLHLEVGRTLFVSDEQRLIEVKLVKPDVGVGFAADHAQVLLRREIVVLLGVGSSRRLEQQPHHKGLLALEHWLASPGRIAHAQWFPLVILSRVWDLLISRLRVFKSGRFPNPALPLPFGCLFVPVSPAPEGHVHQALAAGGQLGVRAPAGKFETGFRVEVEEMEEESDGNLGVSCSVRHLKGTEDRLTKTYITIFTALAVFVTADADLQDVGVSQDFHQAERERLLAAAKRQQPHEDAQAGTRGHLQQGHGGGATLHGHLRQASGGSGGATSAGTCDQKIPPSSPSTGKADSSFCISGQRRCQSSSELTVTGFTASSCSGDVICRGGGAGGGGGAV